MRVNPDGSVEGTPEELTRCSGNSGVVGTVSDFCPCNPKNGGDGVCGCVMGNQEVRLRPLRIERWSTGTNTGT